MTSRSEDNMDERIGSKNVAGSPAGDIAAGLPPATTDSAMPLPNIRAAEPTFMEVFFAWEKLRILYNGLLIVAVLGVALKSGYSMLAGIFFLEPAIYANLGFCAGPVAEGYLCWFGLPRRTCRWAIFASGFLLTLTFAVPYAQTLLASFDK
jgi:hypothetical protein